jgi:hypothetical protein
LNAATVAISDNSTKVATTAAVKAVTDLKAPLANPTFTGTVSAPTVAIDASTNVATNAAVKAVTDLKAPLANPTFTGTVSAPTVAISDNSTKVATTAAVKAVTDLKAPLASPAFTGTVTGVSKTMVGLGNVTNQSKVTMFNEPVFTKNMTLASTAWAQRGLAIGGESYQDESGASVSLSADGNIVAIGAPNNDANGNSSGQVRVYYWDTVTVPETPKWSQRGLDIDGEAANDYSGNSVSLSADGNTVAIGALYNDGDTINSNKGSVRVFDWNGSVWTQRGLDIDGEAAGDRSGSSVSLSADGNTVAIGATINSNKGSVRVYYWDTVTVPETPKWSQRGLDIDGENADDYSGTSVSLSYDGNIVAIGANYNDGDTINSNKGSVRVYYWDTVTVPETPKWSQRGLDIDGENAGDFSGGSVSLSWDGNIVAIGAPNNDANGNSSGQVRVYYWDTVTVPLTPQWSQRGLDINGENAGDQSGVSVSLSKSGNVVAIGARYNSDIMQNAGQVRVYYWDTVPLTPRWTQRILDIDGDYLEGRFGTSVSLSFDGNIVAIGAPWNASSGGTYAGQVKVYDYTYAPIFSTVLPNELGYLSGVSSSIQTQLNAKAPLASPTFTGTVNAADLILSGNLTVNGNTTTISSSTLEVNDKNITLGKTVSAATDAGANGGGLTLLGETDKTLTWDFATNSWTSSENVNLASGKKLLVNGEEVYARLASPTFTGTVTLPAPLTSSNSTEAATTAFVKTSIAGIAAPVVSASSIGLGSVTNESKETMFTNPTFTGSNIYLNASNINIPSYGSLYVSYGSNINVGSRLYDNNISINTHTDQINNLLGRVSQLEGKVSQLEYKTRNL